MKVIRILPVWVRLGAVLFAAGLAAHVQAQQAAPLAPESQPVTPTESQPVTPTESQPVTPTEPQPAATFAPVISVQPAEVGAATASEASVVSAPQQSSAEPTLVWKAKPGKGVTATTSDESFEMNLRGRFQLRTESVAPRDQRVSTNLMVRRARLTISGYTFSKNIQYNMQMAFAARDFEPGSVSPLYDAYINLTHLRDLRLKLGQFMVPHDRARAISFSSAQLVDRSPVVSALNLGRDVGMQFYSEDLFGLGGILSYQLGLFGGEGRNAGGFDAGFMYTARVQVAPFGAFDDYEEADLTREARPRLAIGLGGAYNQKAHRPGSNQGTPYSFAKFNYTNLEADLMFKMAGFSLLTEVMYRGANKNTVSGVDAMGAPVDEYSLSGWGYFAQAGYMLIDHVEVAGRYSELFSLKGTEPDFAQEIHGNGVDVQGIGHEIIGGFSWYIEGHTLKMQADYAYLFGDDFAYGTHVVRVQGQTQF